MYYCNSPVFLYDITCTQMLGCIIFPCDSQVAEELAQAEGVSKLLVAQHEGYRGFLPGKPMPYLYSHMDIHSGRLHVASYRVCLAALGKEKL